MNSFKEIIKLVKEENGKFFVLDASGDPRLVVMSIQEYRALKKGPTYSALAERLEELSEQTEILNKKITDVQKEEDTDELDDQENYSFDLPSNPKELDTENIYIEPIEEEEIRF